MYKIILEEGMKRKCGKIKQNIEEHRGIMTVFQVDPVLAQI